MVIYEKKQYEELLNIGLSTGADFVELFIEETLSQSLNAFTGQVVGASSGITSGIGIRIIKGVDEIYASTNNFDFQSLKNVIADLASTFKGSATTKAIIGESKPYAIECKILPSSVKYSDKVNKVVKYSNLIKEQSDKIVQAVVVFNSSEQKVLIINSLGVYQDDLRIRSRVYLQAVASDGKNSQFGTDGPGRSCGFEIWDYFDFDQKAKDVAKLAVSALEAEYVKPGPMTVVIHNSFGGVLFHEACGHPLEATSVSKGNSPFVDTDKARKESIFDSMIGTPIASSIVTAYDDGTQQGEWGWQNYDDEGHPTQRNLLIENGLLKSYLVDYRNGLTMKMAPTGSSRRQNYKWSPTSRMNVTYIDNGTSTFEEIIAATPSGLFAKKLGGGQVDPSTGEFCFQVLEGYKIEDGKLTTQVKGAMLIGQGKDLLLKIDMVGNNLSYGQGVCGSLSGAVPTDVGEPTIRVSEILVGGQNA